MTLLGNDWNPVSKESQLKHNRKQPKRGQGGKFSDKTIQEIHERDGHRCVKCGSYQIEKTPHHIIFKSQLGKGIKRNGCDVCRACHDWAHGKRKGPNGEPAKDGRQWFVDWMESNLDESGNKIKTKGIKRND